MFTEADLEALVPRKIFERGSMYYYEDNAVGRICRTGDTFKAKVEGTETYRVELTIRAGKPQKIYCDCPYDYGNVCKHGIALGLAVLEWVGPDAPEQAPATPEVLTGKDRRAHLLTAAWARTSDRQRLDFLRQLLLQKPKQLHRFLEVFEFDEAALLAAGLREQPGSSKSVPARRSSPPPSPLPRRSPLPPRRPPTFLGQAHRLIQRQKDPGIAAAAVGDGLAAGVGGQQPPGVDCRAGRVGPGSARCHARRGNGALRGVSEQSVVAR